MLVAARENRRARSDIDEAEMMLRRCRAITKRKVDADGVTYYVKWPMRNYKAQPAKTTEAKPARQVRSKTLTVKEA